MMTQPSIYQQTISRQNEFKLLTTINLVLLVVSLVLLMTSIVLDHFIEHPASPKPWLNDPKTLVDLSRELGFACLIGLVVATTIERSARFEHHKLVAEQFREIEYDVLRKVFEISTPKAVFDAIKSGVLDVPFQRKDFRVGVEMLEELQGKDGNTYIVVELSAEYKIKNNSTNVKTYSVGVEIERPPLTEFESKVQIVSVAVNNVKLPPEALTAGHTF